MYFLNAGSAANLALQQRPLRGSDGARRPNSPESGTGLSGADLTERVRGALRSPCPVGLRDRVLEGRTLTAAGFCLYTLEAMKQATRIETRDPHRHDLHRSNTVIAQRDPGVRGGYQNTAGRCRQRGVAIPHPPVISPHPITGARITDTEHASFLEGVRRAGQLEPT